MKMHEREEIDGLGDRRAVPGGWVYIEFSHPVRAPAEVCRMSSVFVPDPHAEHVVAYERECRAAGVDARNAAALAGFERECAEYATAPIHVPDGVELGNPCPGEKCGGRGRVHGDEWRCADCGDR